MPQKTQRLALLKLLEQNPRLSQRELAQAMGVSLGKANYCLKALIEKSFKEVEFDTFRLQAGSNSFTLSPNKWIEATGAIGIKAAPINRTTKVN